jgi:hypothetical protein
MKVRIPNPPALAAAGGIFPRLGNFVVCRPLRTFTVPAIAALVGLANWWPSRFRPQVHEPVRRAEPVPTSHRLMSHHDDQFHVAVPPSVANRHRAEQTDEQVAYHALPLFGTTAVAKHLAANGLEAARDDCTLANRQHPLGSNGDEPVKTPPVDSSSEDDRVNEQRWIGRWPTGYATFPLDAHNGMS